MLRKGTFLVMLQLTKETSRDGTERDWPEGPSIRK